MPLRNFIIEGETAFAGDIMETSENSVLKDEVKIEELTSGVVHLIFKSRQILGKTLLRFEEFFESTKFRGKIFTLKEFADWYISVKGKFDYYDEWDGFNIPSDVLKPFFEGKFDPLSEEERAFLDIFRNRKGKFYIICTLEGGSLESLKHELCHAMFYANKEYRKQVTELVKQYDTTAIVRHLIKDLLYHQDVLEDEIHAYLLSEFEYLEEEGIDTPEYHELHRKLNEIFDKFSTVAQLKKSR